MRLVFNNATSNPNAIDGQKVVEAWRKKLWISMAARKKTEARILSRATVAVFVSMAEMSWRKSGIRGRKATSKLKKLPKGERRRGESAAKKSDVEAKW